MNDDLLLHRVARLARLASFPDDPRPWSPGAIFVPAAAAYGARPSEEATIPTGFDPVAVSLFEAIVEAAYLVASADGAIEPPERAVLAKIVSAAAGNVVSSRHIDALLEELGGIVADEGVEARLARLPKRIRRVEHAHELLRVAALVALAHEGVSPVERAVLTRLALSLALGDADVDAAVASAEAALGAPDST